MGDFRVCFGRPDGVVMEDRPLPLAMGPVSNPDPSSISEDRWAIAEETTGEVINCIHPTLDSEEKRKDVIDYIQRLIRNSICCEVFPYGSVPLKTYLPDGDIDLTALASPSFEEYLAHNVLAILQWEEHNENAEYEVKDTQFIDAEVKLVKCLVQNIVIDISFNQLGGLSTLCFLEQVDRLVCKDHLFKRSIILIKAWCYYESRILGAHHGLISTYALEILVLYIFHLFHSTLNGPLAVLYRFLDYFSKFDWENYCISLNGPVRRSSLPDVLVEIPENTRDGLMLSEEFLRNCVEMFSVPSKDLETNSRAFPQKHLNIIDPLKESNNLGRSVHRGNFYRIRSAFKHGAHKLGRILQVPGEKLPDEIKKFFGNTLDRHGYSYGLNIRNLSIHSEALSENEMHMKLSNENFDYDFLGIQQNYNISSSRDEIDRYLSRVDDPNELVTPRSSSSSNFCTTENGFFENREVFHQKRSLVCSECSCGSNHGGLSSYGSEILSLNGHGDLENLCRGFKSLDFREMADDAENLSDLSGDYDSHLRSLLYGQSFLGFALSGHTSPSQMMNTNGQSIHSYGNATTPINAVFGSEGKPKPRGTGAYFPKVNSCSWEEKPSQWKGRNRPPVNNLLRESGTNSFGQGNCKHHHQARSYRGLENGLSHQSKGVLQPNGFAIASCKIEFGSLGKLPNWSSKELSPTVSQTQERSGGTTYNLKNEDFPPLSL